MTTTLRFVLLIGILLFFVIIVYLLKKNRLALRYTLMWMGMGICMFVLVIFPQLLDLIRKVLGFEDGTTFMYDGNEYEATVDIKPITNGYVYEYTFTGDDIGALNVGDPFNYESALQNYEKLEITDELISWGQTVMGEVGYVVTSIYGYTDSTGNILFKTQRNGTDYLGGYCQYSITIYYK